MAGRQLIRVRPYHAADPEAPQVWHDRADCETGRWIPSKFLRAGTGDRERCPECERLQSLDPAEPGIGGARVPAEPASRATAKVEVVVPAERWRPRITTVIGALACAALGIMAFLWQTGELEPRQASTVEASIAGSTTTTKPATKVATPATPDVAAALRAFQALHPTSSSNPTTMIPPSGAATPASDSSSADDTTAPASYSIGSDGYTHGTESDGEPCSDNPDDPLFPCAHQIPGSDGIGAPLPGGATTGGGRNAGAGANVATGPAQTDNATRTQRQASRQLRRANRGK